MASMGTGFLRHGLRRVEALPDERLATMSAADLIRYAWGDLNEGRGTSAPWTLLVDAEATGHAWFVLHDPAVGSWVALHHPAAPKRRLGRRDLGEVWDQATAKKRRDLFRQSFYGSQVEDSLEALVAGLTQGCFIGCGENLAPFSIEVDALRAILALDHPEVNALRTLLALGTFPQLQGLLDYRTARAVRQEEEQAARTAHG